MCRLAVGEAAATGEPGGPRGPVDASWLILQRLDDLRRGLDDLRKSQEDLRRELKAEIESVRTWSLGLLLLAILGLLAKLLLPGA